MDFKIIAVDFDGTLCEGKWPDIGAPNTALIDRLKKQKEKGAKLILWTCRSGELLEKAVAWCGKNGLYFDAVNENLPEMIELYDNDTRKIFANEYIDDKNAWYPTTSSNELSELVAWAENEMELACAKEETDAVEVCTAAWNAFNQIVNCYFEQTREVWHILSLLLDRMPLTPIEDTDDVWERVTDGFPKIYQCKRLRSLFKFCYADGTVVYDDVNRVERYDLHETKKAYCDGYIRNLVNEIFPITMPYDVGIPIKVYCDEFYVDETVFTLVLYAVKGDERVPINRYFKVSDCVRTEVDAREYREFEHRRWDFLYEEE